MNAAAAKSLQSCPTLCNSRDGSPPGSPVPRILQARALEWVAINILIKHSLFLLLKTLKIILKRGKYKEINISINVDINTKCKHEIYTYILNVEISFYKLYKLREKLKF